MPRFRARTSKLEAIQHASTIDTSRWLEARGGVPIAIGGDNGIGYAVADDCILIKDGPHTAAIVPDDWIIQDEDGKFRACAEETFTATYEPVDDDEDMDREWARKLAEVTDAMRNLWAQSHSLMTDLENLATETCNLHETLLKLQSVIATTTPPWEKNQ